MSIFSKKVKKNWSLKIQSTDENRERYDTLKQELKELDPDLSFNLEDVLEEHVDVQLKKAEKELEKLKKTLGTKGKVTTERREQNNANAVATETVSV